MKFALSIFFALASSAQAALPFCNLSLYTASGEEGALVNSRAVRYTPTVRFVLPAAAYAANPTFFNQLPHSCLSMGVLTVLKTKEKFSVYRTTDDRCDGGNVIGVVVSQKSGKTVADIDDGTIICR